MQLNGLLEFIDLNRTGFRKALKKHDKVLGDLPRHARLQPKYLPEVDEKFADKNRPHLQVLASPPAAHPREEGAAMLPGRMTAAGHAERGGYRTPRMHNASVGTALRQSRVSKSLDYVLSKKKILS